MMSLSVAIDGPAGAGKSTVARRVAKALKLPLVDTGAIYRCLALVARRLMIGSDAVETLSGLAAGLNVRFELQGEVNRVFLDGEDVTAAIRSPEISSDASAISVHPEVRLALLQLQRNFVRSCGAVVEGRDIGTVVLPNARLKFFLDADPCERARRRCDELVAAGIDCSYEQVLSDVEARDTRDQRRATAPLHPAHDAVVLDSTGMSIDEVVETMIKAAAELTS